MTDATTECSALPAIIDPQEPGYAIFSVPLRTEAADQPSHITLLAVRDRHGCVLIPLSTTRWSHHLALSRSQSTLIRCLATVGRFFEYVEKVGAEDLHDPEVLTTLVFAYAAFRTGYALPDDPDTLNIKGWDKVEAATAWAEVRILGSFFSASGPGDVSADFLPNALPKTVGLKQREFFAHLAPQRERWRRLAGDGDRPVRALPFVAPSPQRFEVGTRDVIKDEEFAALWRQEPSPVYRALWCLLGGGGPRISEALNLWTCDVMPGHVGAAFAGSGDWTGMPFVVLVHPIQGRFVGDLRDAKTSRAAFLRNRWALTPRCLLPQRHPLRAGWKGMALDDRRNLSWVYWTDLAAARAFEEAVVEIRAIHRSSGSWDRHPYLFVYESGGQRGQPVKYRQVVKAFERAARRVGIDLDLPHRNVHGLRHHFVWHLREVLKIPAETRQMILHHKNIESQAEYGLDLSDVYKALDGVWGGRFR